MNLLEIMQSNGTLLFILNYVLIITCLSVLLRTLLFILNILKIIHSNITNKNQLRKSLKNNKESDINKDIKETCVDPINKKLTPEQFDELKKNGTYTDVVEIDLKSIKEKYGVKTDGKGN